MALTRVIAGFDTGGGIDPQLDADCRRFISGFNAYMQSVNGMGALDWAAILTDVSKLFTTIFKNIGDQVPEFPIRTQETLNKITAEIQAGFPPPNTATQAQNQILEANRWIEEAEQKKQSGAASPAVMDTYIMILQSVITTLKNFIQQQTGGTPTNTGTNTNNPPPPATTNPAKTALLVGGAVVALSLLGDKKKVSGFDSNILLTLALVGGGIYLATKKTTADKKAELLTVAAQENDSRFIDAINSMDNQEISDTYELVFYYTPKDIQVTDPALKERLIVISDKYNIFT